MAPTSFKLTYFALKGRGEPIRFLLAYLGHNFQDERVALRDWQKVKPETPWGKLPVLEVGGERATQCRAICRYLAREAGLTGNNSWEDLRIDEAVDVVEELGETISKYYWCRDPIVKASLKEPLLKDTVPFYTSRLEAKVTANGGYLANGKISWADIFFASLSDYSSNMIKQDMLAQRPALRTLVNTVVSIPKINAYLKSRTPLKGLR